MKTICDRCANCSWNQSGTHQSCSAFIDRMTKFTRGITMPYIEQRQIGEKKHCKEFKKLQPLKK